MSSLSPTAMCRSGATGSTSDVTTPLLDGVRIVEVSMLGPAAITTTLADLGAEVIKVEPPQGDYIREMTWPIVEGVSLMHLHVNRSKRSITLDLRNESAKEIFIGSTPMRC